MRIHPLVMNCLNREILGHTRALTSFTWCKIHLLASIGIIMYVLDFRRFSSVWSNIFELVAELMWLHHIFARNNHTNLTTRACRWYIGRLHEPLDQGSFWSCIQSFYHDNDLDPDFRLSLSQAVCAEHVIQCDVMCNRVRVRDQIPAYMATTANSIYWLWQFVFYSNNCRL